MGGNGEYEGIEATWKSTQNQIDFVSQPFVPHAEDKAQNRQRRTRV